MPLTLFATTRSIAKLSLETWCSKGSVMFFFFGNRTNNDTMVLRRPSYLFSVVDQIAVFRVVRLSF
jgi:hypothetical protein